MVTTFRMELYLLAVPQIAQQASGFPGLVDSDVVRQVWVCSVHLHLHANSTIESIES